MLHPKKMTTTAETMRAAAVLAVRVIVPRVLAILRMIVAVALARAGLSRGHYAALQHSSV